ncbi:MAG TPA: cytochrome c [Pyrinomonadaceae bacterium]
MKLIALALACIAIALVAAACTETVTPTNTPTASAPAASPSPTAPPDPLAAARVNYAKHCEACHGPEGVGGLVKVEDKQIKVASLKAPGVVKHTDEELAKVITGGEEAMPAFKDKMSQAEIRDLVTFVRKEFQGK